MGKKDRASIERSHVDVSDDWPDPEQFRNIRHPLFPQKTATTPVGRQSGKP
jgi:hypothetical protein